MPFAPLLLQAILLTPIYFMLIAVVLQPVITVCLIVAASVTWFFSTIWFAPEVENCRDDRYVS